MALDLSLKAGWASLEESDDGKVELKTYGKLHPLIPLKDALKQYGYPWGYTFVAWSIADQVANLVWTQRPTHIAIEETNKGRARYTQKVLEFIHHAVLTMLRDRADFDARGRVFYINTSDWRSNLGQTLSREDRKSNDRLSKAKRNAKLHGEKLDKAALGIRGRVGKKHLSVKWANETYGLSLKMKDNDEADAISVGTAFLRGCRHSDGVTG